LTNHDSTFELLNLELLNLEPTMRQSLYILLSIFLGTVLTLGHELTWLIRYSLMVMLFFTFLGVRFRREMWQSQHIAVVLVNILLPLFFFALLNQWDWTLAMTVFIVGIAPTAAAAPVITSFLRGRVDFVTASVLLTSPVLAIAISLLLPLLLKVKEPIAVEDVLLPIATIVFIPLLLSQAIRRLSRSWTAALQRLNKIPFYLFLFNVYIASADASVFIRSDQSTGWMTILLIALLIGGLCVVLFQLGARLGRPHFGIETSMALGRKNTMFALWIALTFINPVVALGPIFYIFWQNAYNSWQIYEVEKRAGRK